MKSKSSYFCSTIGRKQIVGVTGLGLSLFVLLHMAGNLLIFLGPEAYNTYGHKMVTNPLLLIAEAGLVVMFLAHVTLALKLSIENKMARPESYAVSSNGEKATSLVQKTMWHQGIVIGVFAIYHLLTFKYGTYYEYVASDGEKMRDLHKLIVEVFQQPVYVVGYVLCLLVLGAHLSHGFHSAFRTLGFNHPKYDCTMCLIGKLYAFVVAAGFISQPIYVFFVYR